MSELFERHRSVLDEAVVALQSRGFWSPYPEIPSEKIYGENSKATAEADFAALLDKPFDLPGHPGTRRLGMETSPYGRKLGITYAGASADELVAASSTAMEALAAATPEMRVGLALEILARLHRQSFLMAHAVMHTTGQAFPMAFQAGGPHAQDRGLEAVAVAWAEMTRFARSTRWEKPQRDAPPLVIEKHWTIVPAGIALTIGCNTFPTWNSYPGIFASLVTGNPVIIKPHPAAILPLAITVKVAREVLAEIGLPADAVLLAVDEPGAEITKQLAVHPEVKLIDYTGSTAFASWLKANAIQAQLFSEETGVNTITIAATEDFAGMCANIGFSLSLYSGQMCTSPQNLYVPAAGIETNEGHKSFDEVAAAIASAIEGLLADPQRAQGVAGAIANPATLARLDAARRIGRVVRDTSVLSAARTATPLLVATDSDDPAVHAEYFGPVAFLVAVADADRGIAEAAKLARSKGAITAALYDTDEERIKRAIKAFARAGTNLSINLTGNIFVNQAAAFSDFHVTGANPAGNASLTDTAFVANRFRRVMWRRPVAA